MGASQCAPVRAATPAAWNVAVFSMLAKGLLGAVDAFTDHSSKDPHERRTPMSSKCRSGRASWVVTTTRSPDPLLEAHDLAQNVRWE
eukprot:7794150-Alexandrium_andersonii.AAC.1